MQASIHLVSADVLGKLHVVESARITNCYSCMPNSCTLYDLLPFNACCLAIGFNTCNICFDMEAASYYSFGPNESDLRELVGSMPPIISPHDLKVLQDISYSIIPVEVAIGQDASVVELDSSPFAAFFKPDNGGTCKLIVPIPESPLCHVLTVPTEICQPIDPEVLKQIVYCGC